ncbi:MAG: translation initiation factor IF-2 N-terminal domain-containing protein, partial [Thermoleophilaceae bacterium]|nr:translation initiation factor IF-2 N-terminal domain-containing protein [Thermoleophilaceae bacterium]
MAKIRVHQLAKIRNIASKDLLVQLQAAGINVKAAASAVDEEAAMKALDAPPAPPEPAASKGSANLGDLGVPKVSQV